MVWRTRLSCRIAIRAAKRPSKRGVKLNTARELAPFFGRTNEVTWGSGRGSPPEMSANTTIKVCAAF
ncbi:hypothetical protein COEX109129_20205 [Corallococcus exiguus]